MFITIIIILIITYIIVSQKKSNSPTTSTTNNDENIYLQEKIDYKRFYAPKIFVTTLNELRMLRN